ncbi:CHASE2 domain-containing protein [Hahella ganghwensis]|uniref:CHASE2 domain-containing protein n=1 Tax=Hahella ganghwensis TaxID=286420 RepID=UPI0003603971|nr:adenylate/guanylate cyclase domain-containing protein [Hahella ganghwensis]
MEDTDIKLLAYSKHIPVVLVALIMMFWQLTTQVGDRSFLNRLDYIFYDWRLQLDAYFSSNEPGKDVVIIDIDEASILKEGRWPWSRIKIAALVERLREAEATVVAFDMVLSEAESVNLVPQYDRGLFTPEELVILERAAKSWRADDILAEQLTTLDSVLGFFLHTEISVQTGILSEPLGSPPPDHVLIEARGYTASLPDLEQASTGSGFVTTFPDADGVIRRTPLVMAVNEYIYPSLSLAAVMTYLLIDEVEQDFVQVGEVKALSQIRLTDEPAKTDALGRVLIPYQMGRGQFRYISAWRLLAGDLAPGELSGKLAFVGTSAIGLADLVSTPFETSFPGVEVHAVVAQSLLSGEFPYRPVWEPGALLVFQCVLLILLILLFSGRRPVVMVVSALIVTLVLVGANTMIWSQWHLEFPLVSTLMITQGVFGWYLVTGFIREYTTERRLRGMFAQYVPPEHISHMLDNPEQYSMEGESKELTVLFSDIRSFTTISEQLSASQLKKLLNIYFTPITEAIFQNDGTIDKYVGDMVMAFWGAPVADPLHHEKAVMTAIQMQAITRKISTDLTKEGLPHIRIGIGLNTGIMNVGDMGSEYRKAYTVLGDAVNLGSRLEGLTKFYGVDILVGEDTARGAESITFRFCDRLAVKGKDEAINAYEPIGEKAQLTQTILERLERYHEAIRLYRDRQWQQADELLLTLQLEEPDCRLYQLYRERIGELRERSLPDDWDGVYRHTTK